MPDPPFRIGMDLEVREAKLVEEHVRDLHCFDGRDLSAELEELCAWVARGEDERTVEARRLSKLIMEVSITLVDLGTLPIYHTPKFQILECD
jgi:hypothetical protein